MAEWLFGRRPVAEHLATLPETCSRLLVAAGSQPPEVVLAAARQAGVAVEAVPRGRLDELAAGGNHQGLCLRVGGWRYQDPDDLAAHASGAALPLLLALDSVQDPRNLGALVRVAAGLGAAGVILPKDRAAGLSAAVARAAAGALAHVPVARVTNLARSLQEFKDAGFFVLGSADGAATSLYEARWSLPLVLVLGGEHKGMRPNVARRCDLVVAIPMAEGMPSLNVAVAGGVLGFEILRRARQG